MGVENEIVWPEIGSGWTAQPHQEFPGVTPRDFTNYNCNPTACSARQSTGIQL